jgi:hypothetical protein
MLLIAALQVRGAISASSGWPKAGIDCADLPCVATDFLTENRPPDKLFNSYGFGGYLLYHLGPQTKVFIDGRLDVYDPQVYLDMLAVEEDRLSIDELEKRYDVRTWVVQITDAIGDPKHLASRLAARADHALVHFDDQCAVFVKRAPDTLPYIQQHEFRFANPWKLNTLSDVLHSPATAQRVMDEMPRALDQSQGSSNASALASAAAAFAGDPQTAQQLLQNAAARNPRNPLVAQVQNRLTPR